MTVPSARGPSQCVRSAAESVLSREARSMSWSGMLTAPGRNNPDGLSLE